MHVELLIALRRAAAAKAAPNSRLLIASFPQPKVPTAARTRARVQQRQAQQAAHKASPRKMPYYAVARGRVPGIYESWPEAEAQVRGFRGAIHIKKSSRGEAEAWLRTNMAAGGAGAGAGPAGSSGAGGMLLASGSAAGMVMSRPVASAPKSNHTRADAGSSLPPLAPASALTSPLGPCLLYFDGGARGNPGRGGAGSVVYAQDSRGHACKVWEACTFLPHCTNNEAEYTGLVIGLRWLKGQGVRKVQVRGDSQLVVKQMRGEYRLNAANLLSLYNEATSLQSSIGTVSFAHVYREGNAAADACGNEACDRGQSVQRMTVSQAEWAAILSRYSSDHVPPPTYSAYAPPPAPRGMGGVLQPIALGAGQKRGREEGAGDRQGALKPRQAYASDSSSDEE